MYIMTRKDVIESRKGDIDDGGVRWSAAVSIDRPLYGRGAAVPKRDSWPEKSVTGQVGDSQNF